MNHDFIQPDLPLELLACVHSTLKRHAVLPGVGVVRVVDKHLAIMVDPPGAPRLATHDPHVVQDLAYAGSGDTYPQGDLFLRELILYG